MGESVAIDRSNLLESHLKNAHPLGDKRASNFKNAEEERNLHAVSAVVASQVESPNRDVAKEEPTLVATDTRRSPALEETRRYKNPLLAIFAVMSVARKTMKDVAKSSKDQTRLLKKHWEKVSQEVSDHHDTAAKQTDSLGKWSMGIGLACTILPQYLKGSIPQDKLPKGDEIGAREAWGQLNAAFIENGVFNEIPGSFNQDVWDQLKDSFVENNAFHEVPTFTKQTWEHLRKAFKEHNIFEADETPDFTEKVWGQLKTALINKEAFEERDTLFDTWSGEWATTLEKRVDDFLNKHDFIKGKEVPIWGAPLWETKWNISERFTETFKDHKETTEWIDWAGKNGQKFGEPMVQQWGQQVQMENARDTTVGQQRSQASQTEYQSRKEEKSSEDQTVSNIEQTLQRLMEQEARTFEVRG